MGHYDSCREGTFDALETKCEFSENGKHDYDPQGGGYGVGTCKNEKCDLRIFWT
jgi:hypothetical protein